MDPKELIESLKQPQQQEEEEMEAFPEASHISEEELMQQLRGKTESYDWQKDTDLINAMWDGKKRVIEDENGQIKHYLWGGPVNENWNEANHEKQEEAWKIRYKQLKAIGYDAQEKYKKKGLTKKEKKN